MRLSVRQMAGACWIATADGTLLEVALQDVTPRKSVSTKYAHVRSISSICAGLDERSADRDNFKTYV